MTRVSQPVKRRPYRSEVRQARARETRRRILDSARELFLERGYVRATVREVAERAAVSQDLVFHLFSSKRGLLEQVVADAADVEDPRSLLSGPDLTPVRQESDQRRQVGAVAAAVADQLARVRPLDDMLRTAAVADPDLATLRDELHLGERRRAATAMASWIAERGELRQPLDEAAALVWTLTSPEVHQLLVDGWGWSHEQYGDWLRSNLESGLLG